MQQPSEKNPRIVLLVARQISMTKRFCLQIRRITNNIVQSDNTEVLSKNEGVKTSFSQR